MPPLDSAAGKDDWITAPAASAGKDDWITAPKRDDPLSTPYSPDSIPAPATERPGQSQVAADINAVGQGLVGGTGSIIAGAGRIAQAGTGPSAQRVLAALDLVDQGKNRDAYQKLTDSERQQVGAYRGAGPDDKAAQRDALQQTIGDYDKPNAAIRAGMAIQGAAPEMFPVAPENEGVQTGVGRLIGGVGPALAAGSAGGPVGILASLATIGSQAYDGAYQDAIAKGAPKEQAEDAAGKSAVAQAVTMVAPVSRLLQRVPMPLRDGLLKTLVNLGQNGVEFGSANAVGTFANNYVAQQTYDPGRSLTQGTGDAALEGTIAGLIIPAVGGAIRGGGARDVATPADVMKAPDVDTAIAVATKAAEVPPAEPQPASRYERAPDFVPPSANPPLLPRIRSLINEDTRIADNRPDFLPPSAQAATPEGVPQAGTAEPVRQPSIPMGWGDLFSSRPSDGAGDLAAQPAAAESGPPVPQSASSAASRDLTPPGQIEPPPAEAAANRLQGEVERFATPPVKNDTTIYIPGTKPTLAEVTGDPRVAMDQAYNRQQPEAMQSHSDQENHNAEQVAAYYADTAGSAPTLARLERARDERAQQNIQQVFGDPQSTRPPADPTDVVKFMDDTLADPRMQERDIIRKTIPNLIDRFYNEDGTMKTDPLSLYGIRQHIQDLLNGAGDPETNAAARMLRRELMQVQSRLDDTIEAAAPGFAQYRADYTRDSREIDAMKLLQEERLPLLNKDLHLTPAKWFSLMKGIIEGRSDPMDPASSLSEEQMDRLWNITDQLKRQTFVDAGKPRGSWTSMMQEWGGRFARVAAHAAVLPYFPVVGNAAMEFGLAGLRKRSVNKEMNRVLNPDLGQQAP